MRRRQWRCTSRWRNRRQWDGGSDLIVATALDEAGPPFAVDLNGRPVQLSAETLPKVATLVLVPAESFHADATPYLSDMRPSIMLANMNPEPDPGGGGGGGGSTLDCPYDAPSSAVWQRGIGVKEYISCIETTNDHEPWWKDDPEFSIILTGTDDTDSSAELKTVINIPPYIWTNDSGYKDLDPNLNLLVWDTDYGTRVHVQCMERDGGGTVTVSISGTTEFSGPATVTFEHGYEYEFKDGDDPCGQSDLTPRLSTGQWLGIPNGSVGYEWDGTSDLHWYGYGIQL